MNASRYNTNANDRNARERAENRATLRMMRAQQDTQRVQDYSHVGAVGYEGSELFNAMREGVDRSSCEYVVEGLAA